jgi:aspartokinase
MISLGASRVNVGFVIDETDLQSAVQRLHATFFQSSPIRTDNTVERDS